MKFFLRRLQVIPTVSPTTALAGRIVTTGAVLVCMLWLGVEVYSAGANTRLEPASEDLSPGAELAWWNGGEGQQGIVTVGDMRINIEAYNRKREKDIADASKKLLSLAIDLKSDVDRNAGSGPSTSAVNKARAIEKLAHDMKESMKLNLIVPQ